MIEIVKKLDHTLTHSETPASQRLVNEYSDLFQGIGKLKDFQVKLHIGDTVQPVTQPNRRIPFYLRKSGTGQTNYTRSP